MITILSTKKLNKSVRKKLMDANFKVIEKNFIRTKKIDFQIDTLNEFVLFTSKNAVKSVLKCDYSNSIKLKKIFCVCQKTNQLLKKNGFLVQENAEYAIELGEIIKKKTSK